MQISELSAVRVIADAREHSNGFDGHDRLSNDERCRERDIDIAAMAAVAAARRPARSRSTRW